MKSRVFVRRFRLVLEFTLALATLTSVVGAPTNIFFAQFEPVEGYTTASNLVGQASWLGDGSGGNGLVTNFIAGQGQQAYIGYTPPDAGDDQLVVWQPLNFSPLAAGLPIVNFSVLMNIIDSQSTTNRNVFGWSVYNTQTNRLFSIDFDNEYADITYQLDGTNELYLTTLPFINDSNYTLNVTLNFAANRWSATYNGILIANDQPITTTGALLDLGDIDAEWIIYDANVPGDNYMLFDNYHVTAETLSVSPAQMQFLGRTGEGWALLRVFGQTGSSWAVEGTTNLVTWTALSTNVVTGSYFDVVDTTAAGLQQRLYRARLVP